MVGAEKGINFTKNYICFIQSIHNYLHHKLGLVLMVILMLNIKEYTRKEY